jgi:CDP-paratose 2-epimerase
MKTRGAHGMTRWRRQVRPVLITGGAGFIGSNLADRLAQEGQQVLILDSLARPGVEANLAWLKRRHPERLSAVITDIRDHRSVADAAKTAQAVFHFAAQVAVTTSFSDPREDFETNVCGTILLLDELRRRPAPPPLIFASTNKVYGDLADIPLGNDRGMYLPRDPVLRAHGVSENRPLSFHTPYGCSKGAADQYVLDYARSFGVPTAVLRMSCIYGERQFGTEDQGWVACFVRRALAGLPITVYGDGFQVRDVLHIRNAVDAYLAAWRRIGEISGQAFNLGGGPRNAVSVLQILREIETLLGRPLDLRFADWRPGDQRYFVADTRRITAALGLNGSRYWRDGLIDLVAWLQRDDALVPPLPEELVPLTRAETVHESRVDQPAVEL